MKKSYLPILLFILLSPFYNYAANVTFNVDLSTENVSADGVSVAGDFQAAATMGAVADWTPGGTLLNDNGDGTWSLTLDIPDGTYNYKYINGIAWGDDESAPAPCGDPNNYGNRSFTVASSDQDIAIHCFASCDPCVSDTLPVPVTFRVDMSTSTIGGTQVSVAGSFQDDIDGAYFNDWTPGDNFLDNICDDFWQVTYMLPPGNYEYKYIHGDTWLDAEGLGPDVGDCTVNYYSNRSFTVAPSTPLILDRFLFDSCGVVISSSDVTIKVDMNNHLALHSPTSVSIAGTFQYAASSGAVADWTPGATEMTDIDGDGIYEFTANLPEGTYEYKIVAGDGWDFVETTPDGNNRTFSVNACEENNQEICFSGETICDPISPINATFRVDMSDETVNSSGLFVAGNFQFPIWQKNVIEMLDDDNDQIYEATVPILAADYVYKYFNGTDGDPTSDAFSEDAELTMLGCGIGDYNDRPLNLANASTDTILPAYKYNSCVSDLSSIEESIYAKDIQFYPNPVNDFIGIKIDNPELSNYQISLKNILGKEMKMRNNLSVSYYQIDRNDLESGIYFISVLMDGKILKTEKLILR